MADISKFLQGAAGEWGKAVESANSSSFENPPDGTYIVQLSSAELGTSKADKVQIKWGFTILEGELAGQTKYDYLGLQNARGLEPLAWRLNAMGFKLEDIDLTKLDAFLEDIVDQGLIMSITLVTAPGGGDFQNIKNIKMLPDYQPDEQVYASSTAVEGGDDESGDQVELAAGMKINFTLDGKEKTGIVQAVREKENECDVKVGVKTSTISIDDITGVVEEGTD